MIFKRTGCKVKLELTAQSGRFQSFESHPGEPKKPWTDKSKAKRKRSVQTQAGKSFVGSSQSTCIHAIDDSEDQEAPTFVTLKRKAVDYAEEDISGSGLMKKTFVLDSPANKQKKKMMHKRR